MLGKGFSLVKPLRPIKYKNVTVVGSLSDVEVHGTQPGTSLDPKLRALPAQGALVQYCSPFRNFDYVAPLMQQEPEFEFFLVTP